MTKQLRKCLLLLTLGIMAVTNVMADATVGTAEELKNAIENLTDNSQTITLSAKITLTENITANQGFTINFASYSITKSNYSVALADGVTVTANANSASTARTTIFTTSHSDWQICRKKLDDTRYSFTPAKPVIKFSSNNTYFATLKDAIEDYTYSSFTFLDNVTLTEDIIVAKEGKTAYYSITMGDYTLTPGSYKIKMHKDVTAKLDKQVSDVFSLCDGETGSLLSYEGTGTNKYCYAFTNTKEAKVNETEYETFAEAASAAGDNTITLLRNVATKYKMSENQTLKVAKDGYSITIVGADNYVASSSTSEGVTTYTQEEATFEITAGDVKSYSNTFSLTPTAGNPSTVKLLKDYTYTLSPNCGSTVYGNRSVTLDLGGKTLSVNSNSKDYCILVGYGSTLTIKNGTITMNPTSASKSNGIRVNGSNSKVIIESDATINATGVSAVTVLGTSSLESAGTLSATNSFTISGNGSNGNGGYTVNITGGSVTAEGAPAIYHPNSGTITISDGTITGATGIYQKSGTLNITGGTITGNGAKAEYTYNGNGANATGDAVVIDNCGYPGGEPAPSITGGTFNSTNADAVASYAYDGYQPVTGFVSAGSFNTDPSSWLTTNKGAVKVGDVWKVADVTFTEQEDAVDDQTKESYAVIDNCAAVTEVTTTAGSTSVTIPADVNGNTVTSIAENAFEAVTNKDEIQSVDLSATSISGVEVNRTEGVFADFPEETLIYMPAGNTAAAGEKNVIIKDASDNLVCADFALTDERSYSIPQTFTATNVKLTRNFENGKTCTVCLPYALSTDGIDGTFYYFHSVEGTTVKMKQVTAANLTAYQPYIFVPSANASGIDKSGVNVTIAASAGATMTKGKEEGTQDFTFTGVIEKKTFTSEEIANGIYGFAAEDGHGGNGVGSFVKCSNGAYIEGLRAYLACSADLEATGSAAARSIGEGGALAETLDVILINIDGSTTGIGQIRLINDKDGALYNIKGERLNKATKGIVIKNGRKILVK